MEPFDDMPKCSTLKCTFKEERRSKNLRSRSIVRMEDSRIFWREIKFPGKYLYIKI
jgi:hypothetical protein